MKYTRIVLCLAVAAVTAICPLAPPPAAARPPPPAPHPPALSEPDKKPAPQAPSIPDEYRMSPGDKLRIEVYKDAQLSQSVQVRPDGKVTLPLIGDIEAAGRP